MYSEHGSAWTRDEHESWFTGPAIAAREPGEPHEGAAITPADRKIVDAVVEALCRYEPLRASGSVVRVSANGSTLILEGWTLSQALKLNAERIASRAPGVGNVENKLYSDTELVIAAARATAPTVGPLVTSFPLDSRLGTMIVDIGSLPTEMSEKVVKTIASVPGVRGVRAARHS